MSLTDSNKNKNYSNKTSKNTKVAKIDKKTLFKDHFGKGGIESHDPALYSVFSTIFCQTKCLENVSTKHISALVDEISNQLSPLLVDFIVVILKHEILEITKN